MVLVEKKKRETWRQHFHFDVEGHKKNKKGEVREASDGKQASDANKRRQMVTVIPLSICSTSPLCAKCGSRTSQCSLAGCSNVGGRRRR
jgi:hypothetical protein